ncbi:hypothetical protein [Rubellimicrobium roseum]|uniref:Uncharacterized protein n=1 Tax=Rubellimicrobium roseum TaxID=687525 RepID=A0A5C4NGL2_9RHOB|nr:hypothetical protein [Rubellimicrobium roseum]TNC72186.1 hypothetical protein FHG71_09030 [Rubellimicrobium roseum]
MESTIRPQQDDLPAPRAAVGPTTEAARACAELGALGARHVWLLAERSAALARDDRAAAEILASRLAAIETDMTRAVAVLVARNARPEPPRART